MARNLNLSGWSIFLYEGKWAASFGNDFQEFDSWIDAAKWIKRRLHSWVETLEDLIHGEVEKDD